MKINKYLLGGIALALIAVFAVAANMYRPPASAPAATPTATPGGAPAPVKAELIRPHSPTLGPANAPVTVVEFLDPECESCAAMHPIMKRVLKEFDGRMRLVIRYMPLHGNSVYASSLLEAAHEQNKYWELMDAIFARHPEWASHHAPRPDLLVAYAAQVGIDADRLRTAASAPDIRQRIQQDATDGQALGANRTPTIFVNGVALDRLGYEPLRAAVAAALSASGK